MDSIIRELFYGNLDPNARSYTEKTSCAGAMKTIGENEDFLSKELEGKILQKFLAYSNAWSEVNTTEVSEIFVTGFRMGARFMVDALLMDDNEFKRIED